MEEQKGFAQIFMQITIITFAYAIIAISLTGWFFGEEAQERSELFALGNAGLSFQSIMQIFILSVIIGLISAMLISDIIFKKAMLLWRYIFIWFSCLVASGIFAAVFRWLPLDFLEGWVGFIICHTVLFLIGAFGFVIKAKIEEKRYNKLLSEYRIKHGLEEERHD